MMRGLRVLPCLSRWSCGRQNDRLMITTTLQNARHAARTLLSTDRNALLRAIASALTAATDQILSASELDLAQARAMQTPAPLLDRLTLDPSRWQTIIDSIDQVIALPDPLGQVLAEFTHANGMQVRKLTVPFGVIGMIYEARPNVTVDAAILGLKAGSAMVLRGSASALHSNQAIVRAIRHGLKAAGADPNAVTLLDSPERDVVTELLHARGLVDLVIPRGGAALIAHVLENARVPVIETGTGVCHLYVHSSADLSQALAILINGKTQRPGVCNSLETLLVDAEIAAEFIPLAAQALSARGVEIRGDEEVCSIWPSAIAATQADYIAEFLDLIIAIRVVNDLNEALDHIARFGTKHSEVICARDAAAITRFCNEVDAAAVYANASSRFTDGFEFGFGAEIGISTQKMHARGPMGLREIVTYKYVIDGSGQVR
jgi:glutamate-5-semialdehyde dehydrogenase